MITNRDLIKSACEKLLKLIDAETSEEYFALERLTLDELAILSDWIDILAVQGMAMELLEDVNKT